MITLIPTLISLAVTGVTKLMPTPEPAPGNGSAATAGAASTATPGAVNSQHPDSDFQSLLAWKHGLTSNPALTPNLPDSAPQLAADGSAAPALALRGPKLADKLEAAAPVAATPGTDMASLIGAAAAALQAAFSPAGGAAIVSGAAQAAGAKAEATGKSLGTDPGPIAGAAAPALASPAAAPALAAGADTGRGVETGNAAADAGIGAAAATGAADPAALAGMQKTLRDTIPAVTATALAIDPATVPSQSMALSPAAAPIDNAAQAAPAVTASIATPVGAEGWDQALGQRVVWMVAQKNPTAELHVNPPDLGPLSVTVNVINNTATATFVAAHAATRDAIADAMPRLKDMLAESGISLGQVTVSAESFSQGGSGAGQPNFTARDPGANATGQPSPAASGLVSPIRTSSTVQGLVDTFA